ncbi:MAG: ATP-binding protein [Candidatus Aminicenantales bacterium]
MVEKEFLAQIILDFHKENLPELIDRKLQVSLEIPLKRAIAILGPRRAGKTYYLFFLIKKLKEKGIAKERILYVNFEDPKLIDMSLNDLVKLLEVFYEIYPENKKQKVWLLFDEIQNVADWEVFIRSILDKENAQVFISGSSSRLLSREISTSLRGRTLSYLLLPFSFRELLGARNITYDKYLSSEQRSLLLNCLRDYFSHGGYPETIIYAQQRRKIIQEIIEVTIYRDIIERHRIRNIKVVKLMFNYLVKAKEFSIHKFYNFLRSLNIRVSKNSLYNYLEHFNDAFIFFPLRKFSYSLKIIEQSIPKIYVVDNALIERIAGNEKGKKLENLVFLSLLQRGFQPNRDIFYFTLNNREVDFVIKKGKKVLTLLQCCFDPNDYQTRERELKSLVKASKVLSCNDLKVITFDYQKEEKVENNKIKFIPLWKWLLDIA